MYFINILQVPFNLLLIGDFAYILVTFTLLWKIAKEDIQNNIISNTNIVFGSTFGILTTGWLIQLKPVIFKQLYDGMAGIFITRTLDSLTAATFLGLLFILIKLCPKIRLGAGDIKLAIMTGILLGFYWSFIALCAVAVSLGIFSLLMLGINGKYTTLQQVYPFAPFWLLGAVFAVSFGGTIANILGLHLL